MVIVGVDLGGTKIEAVAASAARREAVHGRRRVATPRDGYDAIVRAVAELVREVAGESGIEGVGVGMPGSVVDGLVRNSNTTCLNGRPFHDDLRRALGIDVVFDNDANCFALAEARLGAGAREGEDAVVFGVIAGTGVGGGLVIGGRVWRGARGIAGEWGHHAVYAERDDVCYCGRRGCLELYVSGPAVEADYARRAGVRRPLAEIAGRRADDEHAAAAIEAFAAAFARGLANVVDVLDPTMIVIGGGVSNLDLLYEEVEPRVAALAFSTSGAPPRHPRGTPFFVKNELGDSAGVFGALLLAQEKARLF